MLRQKETAQLGIATCLILGTGALAAFAGNLPRGGLSPNAAFIATLLGRTLMITGFISGTLLGKVLLTTTIRLSEPTEAENNDYRVRVSALRWLLFTAASGALMAFAEYALRTGDRAAAPLARNAYQAATALFVSVLISTLLSVEPTAGRMSRLPAGYKIITIKACLYLMLFLTIALALRHLAAPPGTVGYAVTHVVRYSLVAAALATLYHSLAAIFRRRRGRPTGRIPPRGPLTGRRASKA